MEKMFFEKFRINHDTDQNNQKKELNQKFVVAKKEINQTEIENKFINVLLSNCIVSPRCLSFVIKS